MCAGHNHRNDLLADPSVGGFVELNGGQRRQHLLDDIDIGRLEFLLELVHDVHLKVVVAKDVRDERNHLAARVVVHHQIDHVEIEVEQVLGVGQFADRKVMKCLQDQTDHRKG